ncbi:gamma-glutamyl-gamma-aminobutyrate hydrolase family protein [Brevibacterium luteolum]|uniref:gamma-glutamyl-gamma-aminobutyrate hydrolase family protein n=1 Tax=Brevibacterium luteolum TaxID=199591 RepID=UPI003EEF84DB
MVSSAADRPAVEAGRRPLIGLPTYYGRGQFGVWDRDSAFLPSAYVTAVTRAGGRVVLLPPEQPWRAAEVAELDGIVLTGGDDVDPSLYGAARGAHTQVPNPRRDAFETQLYRDAAAARVPILAICRGAQIINTVHGGTLHQHIPDVPGYGAHAAEPADAFATVDVSTVAGTRTFAQIGAQVSVRCHHHQAIDRLGDGLHVTGRSADGCIEAFEIPGIDLVAVQWHPEETLDDLRLFAALVGAAAERSGRHRPSHDDSTTPAEVEIR